MAFCKNCGTALPEGTKFCPNCGTGNEASGSGAKAADTVDEIGDKLKKLNNTPDTTADYTAEDINQNKVFAILAYIGILFLVPLFAAKDSKFARFHANQGLLLFILDCIFAFVPLIGWLLGIVSLVLTVIGIINAAQGKAKELPVIGRFRILK